MGFFAGGWWRFHRHGAAVLMQRDTERAADLPVERQTVLPGMEDTGLGCSHPSDVPCIVCDTGNCKVCGKPSIWSRMVYRWLHADGTDNANCWKQDPR